MKTDLRRWRAKRRNYQIFPMTLFMLCTAQAGSCYAYDSRMEKACKKSCSYSNAGKAKKIIEQEKAKVGDFVRCPVSGVVIKVTSQTVVVQHQGQRRFVCCSECAKRFAANPDKYVLGQSS